MSDLPRGRQLESFVLATSYNTIPEDVREAARQALVDYIGVSIVGRDSPAAQPAQQMIKRWGAAGKARVILGQATNPAMAALANGSMTHALDMDDTHSQGCGHPSGPVWSTALAMGQHYGKSAQDALAAFVTGYEVMARLGGGGTYGIGRTLQVRGFHPTSMVGRMGAVCTAAALLKLDQDQIGNALGAVATTAGGLLGSFGTHGKPFHAGKAAMDGILCAELALDGFVGARQLYEIKGGWMTAFLRDDQFQIPDLDFAAKWELLETGYKRFASCRATHTPAEAAILARSKVDGRAIKRVVVYLDRTAMVTAGRLDPKTGLEGRFSIPLCVAMGLLGINLGPHDFTEATLARPEVQALLKKIECITIGDQPEDETHIEVELDSGEMLKASSEIPFGDPRRPFTWDDHHAKFSELVTPVMGQPATEQLFDLLRGFDQQADSMDRLSRMLAAPAD
ncbi:MmgE/PrpD family protein [Xinfangfangia pollutisoli]|uniref:MmgE/PrpD family protein n=1 Tax=Xinfangfangia pollutisoli TaxID=2865960 RepID=UPI001CD4CDE3|nr:MmgE/PrpD family protein [Xinfangfangia pollutisoli]